MMLLHTGHAKLCLNSVQALGSEHWPHSYHGHLGQRTKWHVQALRRAFMHGFMAFLCTMAIYSPGELLHTTHACSFCHHSSLRTSWVHMSLHTPGSAAVECMHAFLLMLDMPSIKSSGYVLYLAQAAADCILQLQGRKEGSITSFQPPGAD